MNYNQLRNGIFVLVAGASTLFAAIVARAHDTWIEANVGVVRVGDVIHLSLMLGNHGNDHRDFKLTGKPTLGAGSTWEVIAPDGTRTDLAPVAVDRGLGAKEGYLAATFSPAVEGMYGVVQTSDRVVDYAPKRSVKTAKAFFVASRSLDRVSAEHRGYDKPLGRGLELVPLTNPVAPLGVGTVQRVRVLFDGKPLAGVRVSFIPRGAALAEGTDPKHDRTTDAEGVAAYEYREATYHLVAAHHEVDGKGDKGGKAFETTAYSATLCVTVPAVCPCCGE